MKALTLKFILSTVILGSTQAMAAEVRDVRGIMPSGVQSAPVSSPSSQNTQFGTAVARALGLNTGSNLNLIRAIPLPNNAGTTLRFNQSYRDIPIWGQQVIVQQSQDGRLLEASGTAVFGIDEATQSAVSPKVTRQQALQKVKDNLQARKGLARDAKFENEEADLYYFLDKEGKLRLTYKVSFFTTVRNDTGGAVPTRPVVFIDADNGEAVSSFENIQHVRKGKGPGGNTKTGKYQYGTGTFPMFEVTEQGTTCLMDSPNVFTENLNHQTTGNNQPFSFICDTNNVKEINGAYSPLNDAQSFGQVIFDMYKDWYGASPLTQKLQLRVHYSSNYENAFWNGSSMTFGDGFNTFFPLVSLDVTAHEVSHGFTEQNSGLIYQNQSGGMNEAFSDMAGEAAEFYFINKYGKPFSRPMPDLDTGADIFKQQGGSLRYICDPRADGVSIDHVRDYQDGLDVHYSSGVYNKAFCILSRRPGWDVKKAFDAFVYANQHYWTPNSKFQDGAEGVLRAASTLGYPGADVIYAFDQVGISLSSQPEKVRYFYNTLRVINSGSTRGCSYSNWDCMTNICKSDLQDQSAWRGWAGCWQEDGNYICYFECGQVKKFF